MSGESGLRRQKWDDELDKVTGHQSIVVEANEGKIRARPSAGRESEGAGQGGLLQLYGRLSTGHGADPEE
jgi:hypothetical protein